MAFSSSRWRVSQDDSFDQVSYESDPKTCPICLVTIASRRLAILSPCSHAYCADCIRRWSNVKRTCPLCNSIFDSWLFGINFRRRTFDRCQLAPEVGGGIGDEFRRPVRRSFGFDRTRGRGRDESSRSRSEFSRSRPFPRKRSFRLSDLDEPEIVAERVIQWRASIYRQKLQAVPLGSSSRNCPQQRVLVSRGSVERLTRVNPWIIRELQAVLGDPDPTIIIHVVTSLYASSLQGVVTDDFEFLTPLRPFLHHWTDMFWHELRCFAESSLTMETYDTVVSYERIGR